MLSVIYSFMVSKDIEIFLDNLDEPNKFLLSLIENSKEYKSYTSSQDSYNDNEPSLFD